MASIRMLKETCALFFDFRVRGTRCREYTRLQDTPANRKKLQKVLERIELDIQSGVFDYARHFPNSKMLGVLVDNARVGGTVTPVAAALNVANGLSPTASFIADTPDFRAYTDTWYDQHEIEWKRSYRLTVRGMLDQHLVPHFGMVPIGQIARDDLLLFRAALGKLKGRGKRASLSPKRINQ